MAGNMTDEETELRRLMLRLNARAWGIAFGLRISSSNADGNGRPQFLPAIRPIGIMRDSCFHNSINPLRAVDSWETSPLDWLVRTQGEPVVYFSSTIGKRS